MHHKRSLNIKGEDCLIKRKTVKLYQFYFAVICMRSFRMMAHLMGKCLTAQLGKALISYLQMVKGEALCNTALLTHISHIKFYYKLLHVLEFLLFIQRPTHYNDQNCQFTLHLYNIECKENFIM